MKPAFRIQFIAVMAMAMLLASCNEKESMLGAELQDPATLYNGICDTAYGVASTFFDDSLLTSGQSSALIGSFYDPLFGSSEAIFFSQITTTNSSSVEFDQYCSIDSVVLSLSISKLFSESSQSKAYKDLHFEVYQLAEPPQKDSAYYAWDNIAVTGNCLFDDVVSLAESDSMVVRMNLNPLFGQYLENHYYASEEEFVNAVKGVRIRLVNDGTPLMATVNLAASGTGMTVYYRYHDTISRTFAFVVGGSAPHFSRFVNNYTGDLSVFNNGAADSLEGSRYLYLTPMGGTTIKADFSQFVANFHSQHPTAIIHHAELLLPVADISPSAKPDLIAALKYTEGGAVINIPDMYDVYTYSGFDGHYDSEKGYYRLRITQHLQKLIGSGVDYGTMLIISGRRSSPEHLVLNGYDNTSTSGNPIRIEFVYSE